MVFSMSAVKKLLRKLDEDAFKTPGVYLAIFAEDACICQGSQGGLFSQTVAAQSQPK
jgi:hypothetical protein